MQFKIKNNSIIPNLYLDYINMKNTHNRLISQNFTDLEIDNLYKPEYGLQEFNIYLYIKAQEFLKNQLNCNKITLTEGIITPNTKYNNILIDLIYMNIPSKLLNIYPISVVFRIKQEGREIKDLTRSDLYKFRQQKSSQWYEETDPINYLLDEMKQYANFYGNYAGDSYTYYTFKQLIKFLLSEVILYKYQGHILTYKQLVSYCIEINSTYLDSDKIRSIPELISDKKIEQIKYKCIKIQEPEDINYLSILDLKIYLVEQELLSPKTFEHTYDTLIEKPFWSFWDDEIFTQNRSFIENSDI